MPWAIIALPAIVSIAYGFMIGLKSCETELIKLKDKKKKKS